MQRVSAFLPSWEKRNSAPNKHGSVFGWSNRSSTFQTPNGLANINTPAAANDDARRIQRETFWPATLDLECDKAARILKSFCVDGYLAPIEDEMLPSPSSIEPQTPVKISKRIPRRIIQNAAGIAVFTCMRSGLWMTGSGGSGILIARKSDGTWSPPSGIMLHTPSLSFIIGVDVYDCVLVISNLAALESVTKPRVVLGDDVHLRSGQSVPLDSDETEVNWRELGNAVLTYMKARGQHQSVNLGGCIMAERCNENERFYAGDVSQMDILAGNVMRHVEETTPLFEVIKMAEGRTDFDPAIIDKVAAEPAPGDAIITTTPKSSPSSPRPVFGFPKADDPDPFGVLALEMAGLEIREAGSRIRPTSSLFDLNQNPMVFSKLNRQSMDTFVSRSNRGSYMSTRTIRSQVTDAGTQTDTGNTPETTPSPGLSDAGNGRMSPAQILEIKEEDEEVDYTAVDETPIRHINQEECPADTAPTTSAATMTKQDREKDSPDGFAGDDHEDKVPHNDEQEEDGDDEDDTNDADFEDAVEDNEDYTESVKGEDDLEDDEDGLSDVELDGDLEDDEDDNDADVEDDVEDDEEEEPVVFEVAAVQPTTVASRMIQARGNVVTIAKRVPPPLPKRSPARMSRINKNEADDDAGDAAGVMSPLRHEFTEADLAVNDEDKTQVSIDSEVSATQSTEQEQSVLSVQHEEMNIEVSEAVDNATKELVTAHDEEASNESVDTLLNEPNPEQAESSDSASKKKHTSSVYTGATEDRWSFDGSSVTTPTSERRFSIAENATAEDTPKKSMKEKEISEEEAREACSPLREVATSPHSPVAAT